MIIEDKGIILSVRKFQERALIIDCFLENHGLIKGYTQRASKKRVNVRPGSIVQVIWKARLDSHLGSINCENEKCLSGMVGLDGLKTLALSAISSLCLITLHEREVQMEVFARFIEFLGELEHDCRNYTYLRHYALLEVELLKRSGFGLDLNKCAATNQVNNLVFISPKSGRAVSQEAGALYQDRLFALPGFLRDESKLAPLIDIYNALKMTGYFFTKHIWEPYNMKEPVARGQLRSKIAGLVELAA